MYKARDLKWGLFTLVLGLFALWHVPGLWEGFTLLEAGQLDSMKLWAPLAWLYNLGGVWAWLAKWASLALLGLGGLGFACWGVWQLLPVKK